MQHYHLFKSAIPLRRTTAMAGRGHDSARRESMKLEFEPIPKRMEPDARIVYIAWRQMEGAENS